MAAERILTDDLDVLLRVLPPRLQQALEATDGGAEPLLEVVMDLGRAPEARYPGRVRPLSPDAVDRDDLRHVLERVGSSRRSATAWVTWWGSPAASGGRSTARSTSSAT
jgi:hypothetical protein